jgi:hypothetical protein
MSQYSDDARCAKRGLTLRTYNVVPMTSHVGLIEWVPGESSFINHFIRQFLNTTCCVSIGTTPLKGVISDQDKRQQALHAGAGHVGLKEAQDAYTNNIYKLAGVKPNSVPHISHAFIKVTACLSRYASSSHI